MNRLAYLLLGPLAAALLISAAGCGEKKDKTAAPPKTVQIPAAKDQEPPKEERKREQISRAGRVMEITEVRNLFQQLKLALPQVELERGKLTKIEDLAPYLGNNQKMMEPLQKGWIVVATNIKPSQAGGALVAWEYDADPNGLRIVLTGSGAIEELDAEAFKKARKAGKN